MSNNISIYKHQSPEGQMTTLSHEMLHAIIVEYGFNPFNHPTPHHANEALCEVLDAPICQTFMLMADNLKMFNRILEGEFSEDDEKEE